MESYVKSVA